MSIDPTVRKWSHLPYFRRVSDREYSSACPKCSDSGHDYKYGGQPDRCRIFPAQATKIGIASIWCRRCGHREYDFPDKEQQRDPVLMARLEKEARERAEAEIKRLHEVIQWLSESSFWVAAHENMTAAQRQLWEDEVPGWCISIHRLGYFDQPLSFLGPHHEQFYVHGESLSIPFLDGGLAVENIQTLQLRLLHPDNGGKYRLMSGLAGSRKLFFPWPEDNDLTRIVVRVEGAKKSMWLYDLFAGTEKGLTYKDQPVTILGTVSKYLEQTVAEELKDSRVIHLLDPDAYMPTQTKDGKWLPSTAEMDAAKVKRSRFVKPPGKIDDLIRNGVLGAIHIQNLIDNAEVAI